MSSAIATIEHIRGETITFGMRATDPVFDGTETVTCDIKVPVNGAVVPSRDTVAVLSVTPTYNDGDWLFTITPEESDDMSGRYITDAKIVMASGFVDYPAPVLILINESVTG